MTELVPIKEIMLGQFDGKEFVRYDLVVKYLFLKKYFKQNCPEKFRYKLYDKIFSYKGTSRPHIKRAYDGFINLIHSFERSGYNEDFPIQMDRRYFMHGGSHRLILAIWHNMKKVPVEFVDKCRKHKRYHTKEWMAKYGYERHMETIKKGKKRLFKSIGL
ncbi:MAG TPA: hypothetical protein VMX17_12185 [Candidatus Glassbacteria bacterium]|nr:hypothetical protein [Candidatus Glassbacteria bacterium]